MTAEHPTAASLTNTISCSGQLRPSWRGVGTRHQRPQVRSLRHPSLSGPEEDRGRRRGGFWNLSMAGLYQNRNKQVGTHLAYNIYLQLSCYLHVILLGVEAPWSTPGTWWQQVTAWPGRGRPRCEWRWGSTSSSQTWSLSPAEHTELH